MKTLHIIPHPVTACEDNMLQRSCTLSYRDGSTIEHEDILWFRFPDSITAPDDHDADSYLIAALFVAMESKRKLIINGQITKTLLVNLTEMMYAWQSWLPNTYRVIEIEADTIVERASQQSPDIFNKTLSAFSGGVDATFTVWAHTQKKLGALSREITSSVLVHGFDIPLKDEQAFQNAYTRSQTTLDSLQIKLIPLKTNFREVITTNWEHTCAAALAAACSNLKSIAGHLLIGSSEPYNALFIPWGSSPITDHLLSSDAFKIIHDGAAFTRTDKIRHIAEWPEGLKNLRVCWVGEHKDKNCGQCEKCVRTALNFKAHNLPVPDCFDDRTFDSRKIMGIRRISDLGQNEWRSTYRVAKENGLNEPWMQTLQLKVRIEQAKSLAKKLLVPR